MKQINLHNLTKNKAGFARVSLWIFLSLIGCFVFAEETPSINIPSVSEDMEKSTDAEETNTDTQDEKNKIGENFYNEDSQPTKKSKLFNHALEDYSWFFEKRQTKQKIGIAPYLTYSFNYGLEASFRLFSYSKDKQGYYLNFFLKKPISYESINYGMTYIDDQDLGFKIISEAYYKSYPDFYYGYGMDTKESDKEALFSKQIFLKQELRYLLANKFFFGAEASFLTRKENEKLHKSEVKIPLEILVAGKASVGYDSRDSWRGAYQGQFHQASFSCVPSLGEGSSFCIGELDLRYYKTVSDHLIASFRLLTGRSFFGRSSYSLNYTLGGKNILRGYSENRFRGHKVYGAQSEVMIPIPHKSVKDWLAVVGFVEAGEVADYEDDFTFKAKWNVGTGLRFGMPPGYRIKFRVDVGYAPLDEEKKMSFWLDFLQAF